MEDTSWIKNITPGKRGDMDSWPNPTVDWTEWFGATKANHLCCFCLNPKAGDWREVRSGACQECDIAYSRLANREDYQTKLVIEKKEDNWKVKNAPPESNPVFILSWKKLVDILTHHSICQDLDPKKFLSEKQVDNISHFTIGPQGICIHIKGLG